MCMTLLCLGAFFQLLYAKIQIRVGTLFGCCRATLITKNNNIDNIAHNYIPTHN